MKTAMKIENPNDVEVTLTITMSLMKWKMIKNSLPIGDGVIVSDFRNSINDVIQKITYVVESNNNEQ